MNVIQGLLGTNHQPAVTPIGHHVDLKTGLFHSKPQSLPQSQSKPRSLPTMLVKQGFHLAVIQEDLPFEAPDPFVYDDSNDDNESASTHESLDSSSSSNASNCKESGETQDDDGTNEDEDLLQLPGRSEYWSMANMLDCIVKLQASSAETNAEFWILGLANVMRSFSDSAGPAEWSQLYEGGFVQAVLGAMQKYCECPDIQYAGALAVGYMAQCFNASHRKILANGGVVVLVNALRNFHDCQHTVVAAVSALSHVLARQTMIAPLRQGPLKTNKKCVEKVVDAGGVNDLVNALVNWPDHEGICFFACQCLLQLTFNKENAVEANRAGAHDVVEKTMDRFRFNSYTREVTKDLLENLDRVIDCGCFFF